ncbi:MAG TPA: hypothetical protein VFV80_03600 [Geminicoccaceae bacterium]|nr:hypothetical protein [Geminicoccaceae bacterium]
MQAHELIALRTLRASGKKRISNGRSRPSTAGTIDQHKDSALRDGREIEAAAALWAGTAVAWSAPAIAASRAVGRGSHRSAAMIAARR